MTSCSRTVTCSNCGFQQSVQPLSWSVRCPVCLNVIRVHRHISRVTGWARSVISDLTTPSSWGRAEQVGSGWPATYPRVWGKKRAVLCGVSYIGRRYELKGTVNDVNCMKYLLTTRYGFPEECILVLAEGISDPYRIPTRENILSAMRWVVHNVQPGDSIVFHFSGHGSQKVDNDDGNDERDGLDETLCPLDYEANGMILDDEINDILVRPIPHRAKLHAIIDACHSGTVLDLPYLCRINRAGLYQWEDQSRPSRKHKGTSGGLAICISGCDDHQTSADTTALSGTTTTGAMTYSLILAVENEPGTTYGRLLFSMRSVIRGANTSTKLNGPIASFACRVFRFGLRQKTKLTWHVGSTCGSRYTSNLRWVLLHWSLNCPLQRNSTYIGNHFSYDGIIVVIFIIYKI